MLSTQSGLPTRPVLAPCNRPCPRSHTDLPLCHSVAPPAGRDYACATSAVGTRRAAWRRTRGALISPSPRLQTPAPCWPAVSGRCWSGLRYDSGAIGSFREGRGNVPMREKKEQSLSEDNDPLFFLFFFLLRQLVTSACSVNKTIALANWLTISLSAASQITSGNFIRLQLRRFKMCYDVYSSVTFRKCT